jgi:hypothetical protein
MSSPIYEIPRKFPVLENFGLETSSQLSASTAINRLAHGFLQDLLSRFRLNRWQQTLLNRDFRVHDRRGRAVHVIFVAQQAVLPRLAAGVACLAKFLLHRAETCGKFSWAALFVALEIRAILFKAMASETAAIVHDAHVRFMDEIREASPFARD